MLRERRGRGPFSQVGFSPAPTESYYIKPDFGGGFFWISFTLATIAGWGERLAELHCLQGFVGLVVLSATTSYQLAGTRDCLIGHDLGAFS